MYGKIKEISVVDGLKIQPVAQLQGKGGRLGMSSMINVAFGGYQDMDGYKVVTEDHEMAVLIDNGQSCCESWGYFSSDDDLQQYIGAELKEVNLVDVALNVKKVEDNGANFLDEGGIQFVNFVTDKGTFQLAVYNVHNGYYGHGIVVAKDTEVLLNETL